MTAAAKTLLVDLDGTLIDYDTAAAAEHTAVSALIAQQIGNDQAAQAMARFHDYLTAHHHEVDTGQVSVARFRQLRLQHALAPWSDPTETLMNAVAACADHTADSVTLIDGVEQALTTVRQKGFAIAIVTNGPTDIQQRKCRRLGLDRLVDAVITSHDSGYLKPQRQIFDTAIERLNSAHTRTTMIGDSWPNDVLGALRAGIRHTIHIGSPPDVGYHTPPGHLGSAATFPHAAALLAGQP